MDKSLNVLVSGTYDILHGGHIQFFEDAKTLGDTLTVCFASGEIIKLGKNRVAAYPDDHKRKLLESLRCVDRVVESSDLDAVFNFDKHAMSKEYHVLAVTSDDKHIAEKVERYPHMRVVVLPKRNVLSDLSTTKIRYNVKND